MPRPTKNGLAYFPFDVLFFEDDKIEDLLEEYGPLGVTIYTAILCLVYREGYYLASDLSDLARKVQKLVGGKWVKKRALVIQVIHYCVELGLIAPLTEQSIITSEAIQRRYAKAAIRSKTVIDRYRLIPLDAPQGVEKKASSDVWEGAPEKVEDVTSSAVNATKNRKDVTSQTTEEEKDNNINISSSLARTRASEGRVFLSNEEQQIMESFLTKRWAQHYMDAIANCEARGKIFKKSHFQAIKDMAEADGVWGVKSARPPKKPSAMSFDPEEAWEKAIKKSYGENPKEEQK